MSQRYNYKLLIPFLNVLLAGIGCTPEPDVNNHHETAVVLSSETTPPQPTISTGDHSVGDNGVEFEQASITSVAMRVSVALPNMRKGERAIHRITVPLFNSEELQLFFQGSMAPYVSIWNHDHSDGVFEVGAHGAIDLEVSLRPPPDFTENELWTEVVFDGSAVGKDDKQIDVTLGIRLTSKLIGGQIREAEKAKGN